MDNDDKKDARLCEKPHHKHLSGLERVTVKDRSRLLSRTTFTRRKHNKAGKGDWVGVFITSPSNLTKEDVIQTFQNDVEKFMPFGFHTFRKSSIFYLEGPIQKYSQLTLLSRRLRTPSGRSCYFMMNDVNQPNFSLSTEHQNIVKQVLLHRYSPSNGNLNMEEFHLDDLLLQNDILAPVAHHITCKTIQNLIYENIEHINVLNLKNNKLRSNYFMCLASMVEKYGISSLNLSDNSIECINYLIPNQMASVLELDISNNSIMSMPNFDIIKAYFPNLEVINGMSLEAYFEKEMEYRSRNMQGLVGPLSHIKLEEKQVDKIQINEECLKKFITEYFSAFDCDQRNAVLNAYVPNAVLNFISHNAKLTSSTQNGIHEISSFLSTFPQTKHDIEDTKVMPSTDSGSVEISGQIMLEGCEEISKFSRKMVIVKHNEGLCCRCDTFEIE